MLVLQAMGRKIGFIPAAARLADPKREMPLQIYLAESKVSWRRWPTTSTTSCKRSAAASWSSARASTWATSASARTRFGHTMFGASETTVAQIVVNYLNTVGLAAPGAARGNVPGTDQRHTMIYASTVDLDEAYKVGQKAALIAAQDGSG